MKRTLVIFILGAIAATASTRAADTKEIWDKQCLKCHGADGKGETKMGKKAGAKDYTDAKVQAAMKDEEMAKIIKQGKKDGENVKMKAFPELSESEIKALVAYVRAFKK